MRLIRVDWDDVCFGVMISATHSVVEPQLTTTCRSIHRISQFMDVTKHAIQMQVHINLYAHIVVRGSAPVHMHVPVAVDVGVRTFKVMLVCVRIYPFMYRYGHKPTDAGAIAHTLYVNGAFADAWLLGHIRVYRCNAIATRRRTCTDERVWYDTGFPDADPYTRIVVCASIPTSVFAYTSSYRSRCSCIKSYAHLCPSTSTYVQVYLCNSPRRSVHM